MARAGSVLVVEDNQGVRQLVGAILGHLGANVLEASRASEAFEVLENHPVDVLFADLRLPDVDGLDVIRQAIRLRPRVAPVVLTGAASFESAVEALRLGACDYVTKPVDRHKIASALERARASRQIGSPVAGRRPGPPPAGRASPVEVVAASPSMRAVVTSAQKLARLDLPVLIQGEAGVGKKLVAHLIHSQGFRPEAPLVHVVCAAVPEVPFPGEGVDAVGRSGGLAPEPWDHFGGEAGDGTLFLQEVGQLPRWAQFKLLNLLEVGWRTSLAGATGKPDRVRVIATTTSSLEPAVAAGRFHRGVYDYLNLAPLKIPPLRERPQDVAALAQHFLDRFNQSREGKNGHRGYRIPDELFERLVRYRWPGNARELASVMARAVLEQCGVAVEMGVRDYLRTPSEPADTGQTISVPLGGDLRAIQRHVVREMVRRHGGNKAAAARALGLHRRTLYRILENGQAGG